MTPSSAIAGDHGRNSPSRVRDRARQGRNGQAGPSGAEKPGPKGNAQTPQLTLSGPRQRRRECLLSGREQALRAHTHVLAMLMGEGDAEFTAMVRRPLRPEQILFVGPAGTSAFETAFIRDRGIARLGPEDQAGPEGRVMSWLRTASARKVALHFDVDVLDPSRHGFLLFHQLDAPPGAWDHVPKGGMTFEQVAGILNAVDAEADVVGLASGEYLLWKAIALSRTLGTLPLLGPGL